MGIDEVNIAGGYRCVITNLATNNVFDMLEYRTQDHLKPFFSDLKDSCLLYTSKDSQFSRVYVFNLETSEIV